MARAVAERGVARVSMLERVEELEAREAAGSLLVADRVALNLARWGLEQIAAAETREQRARVAA